MRLREHPFTMQKAEKDRYMTEELLQLTAYHQIHCQPYAKMLQALSYDAGQVSHYRDLPYLPVTLFKKLYLSSMDTEGEQMHKTLTSSGTSGQAKSQIVLDGGTQLRQQQVLAGIVGDFIGKKRMPMLIIDCPATVKQRHAFSARTAGIRGFSLFGTKRVFALRDDMSLDFETVEAFLEQYAEKPFFIFGFTFMVWKYFCQELQRRQRKINCENGILIHGGGWKTLAREAVSKDVWRTQLADTCALTKVHDYYGMAEQSGSIFMECACGHLHCSDYSGVVFRRAADFSPCETGETGLIQVLSLVPKSYPGHSLLTEDLGRMLGEDDCPCGRAGVYFEVLGRAAQAELRGCSDTYGMER